MNFKTFTTWLKRRAYGESSNMRLHEERFHGPHFIDVYYMDHPKPKPRVGCKCPGDCERPGHGHGSQD